MAPKCGHLAWLMQEQWSKDIQNRIGNRLCHRSFDPAIVIV